MPWLGLARNRDAGRRREMVADCEAFLLGRLAERLEDQGVAVPVWAWTNLLAHASEGELRAEITAAPQGRPDTRDWHRARAFLAAEVLSVADARASLVDLQERCLRPMELDLAESLEVTWWRPSELAMHVDSLLAPQKATERYPSHSVRSRGG